MHSCLMARNKSNRRRRNFGKYLRGSVDEQLAVGALAGQALVSQTFDETVTERTRVSSVIATWGLRNWTPVQDAGPLVCGIAHSDYTDAEIEAVIENAGSWNAGGKVEQEIAKRLVRRVGMFEIPADISESAVLFDGRLTKTKLNWSLQTGQTLRLWVYNTGQTAVDNTVNPEVVLQGHANLWAT